MKPFRFLILALAAAAAGACSYQDSDLCRWVDPKIGSGEFGHVFVGADIPFGAVQLGPISVRADWDLCSGYHSTEDSTCIGFSHTRLGGSGMRDLCDVTLMPVTGEDFEYARGTESDPHSGLWSYADRRHEISEPGYYSVPLTRYGILAEVTSGNRVGYSRFTFPASEEAAIVIDLENGSGKGDETTGVELRAVSDRMVVGRRSSMGWSDRGWDVADNEKIWFVAEFSKPFENFSIKGNGMYGRADFSTAEGEQILVRVGISPVSIENAELNLRAEATDWDFDKVRSDAREAWNRELGKIRIKTSSERTKRIFYTALYHSTQFPSVFSDVNGGYYGGDGRYYRAEGFDYYTNLSLWDTYRAVHPLYTLLMPESVPDLVKSMLTSCEAIIKSCVGEKKWEEKMGEKADISLGDTIMMCSMLLRFSATAAMWIGVAACNARKVGWSGQAATVTLRTSGITINAPEEETFTVKKVDGNGPFAGVDGKAIADIVS